MWWVGLLFAYLACLTVNWRAGAVLLVGLAVCQVILHYKPENSTFYIFAAYSTIGVMTFLFLDKAAGAVVCLVGVVYGISLIDLIGYRGRTLSAEVVFYLGALICGLGGPTGGLRADISDQISVRLAPAYHYRFVRVVLSLQESPRRLFSAVR